jgi:hypothetical protein
LEKLCKSSITDEIFFKLNEIDVITLLNPSDLINKNRAVSYLSIILREICNYHSQKTENGFNLYKIRRIREELKDISKRLDCSFIYL